MRFLFCLLIIGKIWGSPLNVHVLTKDYQKGKEVAEGHALPMALIFTGSDWSEASEELIEELMHAQPPKELVCIQVDFPELNFQEVSQLKENHLLREKYSVEQFPLVLVTEPGGEEITRMGYPIEGVENFFHHLESVSRRCQLLKIRFEKAQQDKNRGELKLCFEEARTLGFETLQKEIICLRALMLEKYLATGDEALRKKLSVVATQDIKTRLALIDFQKEHSAEPLENYIETFGDKASDHCWKIHLVLSEFLHEEGRAEEAVEHAQVSHRYAPAEEKSMIGDLIPILRELFLN